MTVFVHLALDRFGAECVGRALGLSRYAPGREEERHVCVWGGVEGRPGPRDVWDESIPSWDDAFEWPSALGFHPGDAFQVNRQSLAAAARAHVVASAGALAVERLLQVLPTASSVGRHLVNEPVLILTGSLADPVTSGLLLGFLSGLARLRYLGRINCRPYTIVGAGAASGPVTCEPERARVLVGQGMLDLEGFMAEEASARNRASPLILIGEDGGHLGPTVRAAQVSQAGTAVWALARSLVDPVVVGGANPFRLEIDAGGGASLAGVDWDRTSPFSVLGAYTVSTVPDSLSVLIASRICREVLASMAAQQALPSLEAAQAEVPAAHLATLLTELEGRVAAKMWSGLSGLDASSQGAPVPVLPEIGGLDRVFGELLQGKEWERILAYYGSSRLRALPLDDWPTVVDDLTSVVDQGLMLRRRQDVVERTRQVIQNLLAGLDEAVGHTFGRAFSEPVRGAPHRVSQLLLGRILTRIEARKEELRQLELLKPSGVTTEELRRRAAAARDRFKKSLSLVPSPVAVWLRLVPITGLALGLLQLLPVALGVFDSPRMRLLFGAAVGGAASLGLFLIQVDTVRRRLTGDFEQWLSAYRALLERLDQELIASSRHQLLDAADALLRWYFSGSSSEPPMPEGIRVPLRFDSSAGTEVYSDDHSRQEVLGAHADHLLEAASRFDQLSARLSADFEPSDKETVLPEIRQGRTAAIEAECRNFLAPDGIGGFLSRSRKWLATGNGEGPAWFLPFEDGEAPTGAVRCPAWRRTFWLPDGVELLDVAKQRGSSAFRFLTSVKHYVLAQLMLGSSVADRVAGYVRVSGVPNFTTSPLAERYQNASGLSMPVVGGNALSVVMGAGPDDLLARTMGETNQHGGSYVSAHIRLCHRMSADELLAFPNAGEPSTALGKAWRAHRQRPVTDLSCSPVEMVADEVG